MEIKSVIERKSHLNGKFPMLVVVLNKNTMQNLLHGVSFSIPYDLFISGIFVEV